MNVVGKVSSFITQGMYSVATPFHPFGGAVDIVVVKQHGGTFRSTPWYVRFGKFQGVLKGAEKIVRIEVNGVEANFHMYLDNSGEAYFVREVDPNEDSNEGLNDLERLEGIQDDIHNDAKVNDFYRLEADAFSDGEVVVRDEYATLGMDRLERDDSDAGRIFYEFQDEQSSQEDSGGFVDYSSSRFDELGGVELLSEPRDSDSEVVLVSVDGHILTAPISSPERNIETLQLSSPQFHLGQGSMSEECHSGDTSCPADYLNSIDTSAEKITSIKNNEANNGALSSLPTVKPDDIVEEIQHHAQETQGRENFNCYSSDDTSNILKRDHIFESSLMLQELAPGSTNNGKGSLDSSLEMREVAETPLNKSPRSPLAIDLTEKGNNEVSSNGDGLSTYNIEHPSNVSLLKDEIAPVRQSTFDTCDKNDDGLPVQTMNNGQESVKPVDVDLHPVKMLSGEEAPTSEDKCCNSGCGDPHIRTLIEGLDMSLCGNFLHNGMGLSAAEDAFNANRISFEEFKLSSSSIVENENLIIRIQGKYLPWKKAARFVLCMAAFGSDLPVQPHDIIPVEQNTSESKEDDFNITSTPSRRWSLWPIPFRNVKTLEHTGSNSSNEEVFVDSGSFSVSQSEEPSPKVHNQSIESPRKKIIRTNVPTTEQIASLNLKEGQNMVNFIFSTRVLGSQKVDAHIYLWKWNTRIVISDVDGTITRSDVLGQFMPLVGKDWTHSGIARLFCAIKENGYQLLFLSARAIVQAYLTKSFLFNLKQDGKTLPNGPVVISPDGLFPSLYREVIRRAPHEFKIACLEDIKALFPPDYNPFYAGFGNRDTDELSYRKIGIPKGKIFIINPKGEVAINNRVDVKSYTSLHTLVNDMFPSTSLIEQEDYNSWNYWKMPLPEID